MGVQKCAHWGPVVPCMWAYPGAPIQQTLLILAQVGPIQVVFHALYLAIAPPPSPQTRWPISITHPMPAQLLDDLHGRTGVLDIIQELCRVACAAAEEET